MFRHPGVNFFAKNAFPAVDVRNSSAILPIPPEAGLPQRELDGVVFLHILGLQIGTQFCPGLSRRVPLCGTKAGLDRTAGLGFFVAENVRSGWFFDIYIQGSKNNF